MRMRLPLLLLAVLVLPVTALAKPITLKFPRFQVPPHSDREVCSFIKVPLREPFDASATLIVNVGGDKQFVSHHFLLYAYTGSDIAAFPAKGVIADSKACLDFGPSDRSARALLANSQVERKLDALPRGVAQQIVPTGDSVGIIMNTHWINSSDKPKNALVKIKIKPAKRGSVRRYLKPIFEVVANGFIDVAPGEVETVNWSWGPGQLNLGGNILGGGTVPAGPACVYSITSHTHKRGLSFNIDLVRKDGTRTPLLETLDYADPVEIDYTGLGRVPKPILMQVGDRLEYRCKHDNGVTTPVRLGCEEEPGKAPGKSVLAGGFVGGLSTDGAAKRCATPGPSPSECPASDPAYPGRSFTGNCVPANLVFGFTSEDDMCIMPGAYFEPNLDAPGNECDVKLLR